MSLNFVILILFSCAICSFASLDEDADTCLANLQLNDTYRELLHSESLTLSLNQYDEDFVKLLECIFKRAGAIVNNVIQPEVLTSIINEVFAFEEDEIAIAVDKCKNETAENSLDTLYTVGECLDKELQ